MTATAPGTVVLGNSMSIDASATVNFTDLARAEAQLRLSQPWREPRVRVPSEFNGLGMEVPSTGPPAFTGSIPAPPMLNITSSPPTISFQGLDDIAMVDSGAFVIPPDVGGGVGLTKVMNTFNNNYRIQNKSTGATLLTVGTATFWNPVVTNKALLNQLFYPRTTYDPIQGRWIACIETTNDPGLILFGVSVTSDPAGSWFLYAVTPGFTGAPRLDFPSIGFNKNWIAITINAYTSAGAFSRGGCMMANYPQAASGTLSSVTNITQALGTHFCTAPCVTLSATEDTLYLVTHLSSAGATFVVDRITGTAAAPTYTTGSTTTRPGGGWVQPSGNLLPQSAPNAGASACGATPCRIEVQDAQVRSAPTFRADATTGRQFIYYTQSIGLPGGAMTHAGVQWTKITASTTAPVLADGGRIEDPTATATNGGKWYAYPHIAVNSTGDWIVGYSQFSSAQHPSAGYSYHHHIDGPGTMRDPFIYKVGEDYYHKDLGLGRIRWGDYSTAQVDPTDDQTLWVVQEYAKARTGTDDGSTISNGSKWSTYWAAVPTTTLFTVTASAGAGGTISPSGSVMVNQGANQAFTITADGCFHINDVLVDGVSQGAISTFTFTNVQATHTISATFALSTFTIAASAGANGSISPTGNVSVDCGASQAFTITPAAGYHVANVLVDGSTVGAVTTFTFTNVTASHTIATSFAGDARVLTTNVVGGGTVTKLPNQLSFPNGTTVQLTADAGAGWAFSAWSGDLVSTTNPDNLLMDADKTVTATFLDIQAPTVTVTAPNGGESLTGGSHTNITWTAADNAAVTAIDLELSRAGAGGPYESIATGLANTGTFDWLVTMPVTSNAMVRATAHDAAAHTTQDLSNAEFTIAGSTGVLDGPVTEFALAPVWPNPVRMSTQFRFALPRDASVQLAVHDVQGRELLLLADGGFAAGRHSLDWSSTAGAELGPGLYFLRLTVPGRSLVRRFVLMR